MFSSWYEPANFGILVPLFPGPEKWRSFGPCVVFVTLRCTEGRNSGDQLSLYPVHLQQDAGLAFGVAKRWVLNAGAVLQQ